MPNLLSIEEFILNTVVPSNILKMFMVYAHFMTEERCKTANYPGNTVPDCNGDVDKMIGSIAGFMIGLLFWATKNLNFDDFDSKQEQKQNRGNGNHEDFNIAPQQLPPIPMAPIVLVRDEQQNRHPFFKRDLAKQKRLSQHISNRKQQAYHHKPKKHG